MAACGTLLKQGVGKCPGRMLTLQLSLYLPSPAFSEVHMAPIPLSSLLCTFSTALNHIHPFAQKGSCLSGEGPGAQAGPECRQVQVPVGCVPGHAAGPVQGTEPGGGGRVLGKPSDACGSFQAPRP